MTRDSTKAGTRRTQLTFRSVRGTTSVLLGLVVVTGLLGAWRTAQSASGIDFYQFWVVGQTLGEERVHQIYTTEARQSLGAEFAERARRSGSERQARAAEFRPVLETYSTPFLYTMFRIFSTGHYDTDLRNYRILLFASALLGVAGPCLLLGFSFPSTLAAVALVTSWFEPFTSDVRVGNVNSLQLGALAVWLLHKAIRDSRLDHLLSGALLGLLLMFKPNLVFVVAVLAVARLFNGQREVLTLEVAGGAVGALSAFVLSSLVFGTVQSWFEWLSALRELPDDIIPVAAGNFSLSRVLNELMGTHLAFLFTVIFLGVAVAALWSRRTDLTHHKTRTYDVQLVALGCLVMMLSSKLAWLHYFLLALPMALTLLRSATPALPHPAKLVSAGAALWAISATPLFHLGVAGNPMLAAVLACTGSLVLFVLGVVDISTRKQSKRQ